MDEPVDGGECHGLVWKDFPPLPEGLICGDEQRAPFVAGADQLEEDAGFGLILSDIGDVVEDEEMASRGELSPSALSDPSVRLSPHSAPIK